MSWDEDSVHRWLARRPRRRVCVEHGNDAAVVVRAWARPVLCVDQTIEGVHFDADVAARRVGWKACARSLSDLAATAAEPRAVLLALRAPRNTSERRLRELIAAVDACAQHFGAELIGGDSSCASGPLSLTVTAVGELRRGARVVSRAAARPGQVVVSTGAFGGSLLGRHLDIEPRFAAAHWLVGLGATAMMDVSDGLALDVSRIARASRVAIDLDRIPIHSDARRMARRTGRSALAHALGDGEDHELIATLPNSSLPRALAQAAKHCPGLAVLGRVRAGRGVRVPRDEASAEWVDASGAGGWIHGR